MATSANMNTSYELANFEKPLAQIISKAEAEMNKEKGGAAKLKADIATSIDNDNFVGMFQVRKPEIGRRMSIGELCQSYVHETTLQVIDPSCVEKILFGQEGLIHKAGGGRCNYLMEDIEVGYVEVKSEGIEIGPQITSGRHRLMATQILLHAAGFAPAAIAKLEIRVSVIKCSSADELQRRIIQANGGPRTVSRSEIRERRSAKDGVLLLGRASIAGSIHQAETEKVFKAALGSWIKDAAYDAGLNTLTPAQYSDAGNSLWNALAKKNKPEGRSFYAWVKEDAKERFLQIARAAENALPAAVEAAINDRKAGAMAPKLANALLPVIVSRCLLQA